MKSGIFLMKAIVLVIIANMTACQSDEVTSTQIDQDSLKIALMQARLDSMERAVAVGAQSGGEQSYASNSGGPSASSTETYTANRNNKKPYREAIKKVPKAGNNFFAKDMGNYPEGSNRLLTSRDLQHISSWGYTLMLNEIYARHGMSFNNRELQNHFNNQTWYRTGRKNVDKSLSSIEKQNIQFLKNNPK